MKRYIPGTLTEMSQTFALLFDARNALEELIKPEVKDTLNPTEFGQCKVMIGLLNNRIDNLSKKK